ncbi:MAG TPA: MXAN_5187 C-terminal domain-containing protein [Sandaracinaceae bacterium]
MRTKIIAGNLVAVLVVGLISYLVVSEQLKAAFVAEVDSHITTDQRLFERTWRLSGLEFVERVAAQAAQDASRDLFSSLDEVTRRRRAHDRANQVAEWFQRQSPEAGRPEVVAVTDADGAVIARNQDLNRMYRDPLAGQITALRDVLEGGAPAVDVWAFSDGQRKLLQTAMAPIRDVDGDVIGALVVGYDMSNGMAQRAGALLGREVAFLTDDAVYSSSFDGAVLESLRGALFTQNQAATRAALANGQLSEAWTATVGGREYVGVVGPLPLARSARVAFAVMADRTAALEKASPANMILVLTGLGLLVVLIYGFLVATSFLKPIEQMEEGVLAVINGRTDLRLDIRSAELGGLAYRINQLLNVFTGTPEADDEGRVSSPPEAWGPDAASVPGTEVPAGASGGGEQGDPELAAKLAEEPEDAYYERIYNEYVAAKQAIGENVSNITKERFVQRLQANEKSLMQKHGCRMVRFQVQTKGTQVNLLPVVIR